MTPWSIRPPEADPPPPDPLTTVVGLNGMTYACPDLTTLDSHLVALTRRLRHAAPHFPSLARGFRIDIDRLLERRMWLELELELDSVDTAA